MVAAHSYIHEIEVKTSAFLAISLAHCYAVMKLRSRNAPNLCRRWMTAIYVGFMVTVTLCAVWSVQAHDHNAVARVGLIAMDIFFIIQVFLMVAKVGPTRETTLVRVTIASPTTIDGANYFKEEVDIAI